MMSLLLVFFVNCATATESDSEFDALSLEVTCDTIAQLHDASTAPFAHGEKKQVAQAAWHSVPVVVSRPYVPQNTSFVGHDFERYFVRERRLHAIFKRDGCRFVPQFLGGCWQRGWEDIVLVVELVRGFMDAATDPSVTWAQRLMIAIGTLDVLQLLERFPTGDGAHTRAMYGDLFAKQFGIDRNYTVKFVDVQSFVAYATERFGSDRTCRADADCMASYWSHGPESTRVLRGMRRLDTDDFGCDLQRGMCRGLDGQTLLMALCHLLIEPMFRLAEEHTPAHVNAGVVAIIGRCVTGQRAQRAFVSEIRRAFEALLPLDHVVPPLEVKTPTFKPTARCGAV